MEQWLELSAHMLSLSLFTVGGVLVAAPEMHQFLVDDMHWLTDLQFTSSIALAQAAPGPNVLFVALLGWNIGVNASTEMGSSASLSGFVPIVGALVALFSIIAPSASFAYFAGRWLNHNRNCRAVQAFRSGVAPIVIGLLVASGWRLASIPNSLVADHVVYLVAAISTLVVWRSRVHVLWLIAAGAVLGFAGVV